jgi:hypothetical protein
MQLSIGFGPNGGPTPKRRPDDGSQRLVRHARRCHRGTPRVGTNRREEPAYSCPNIATSSTNATPPSLIACTLRSARRPDQVELRRLSSRGRLGQAQAATGVVGPRPRRLPVRSGASTIAQRVAMRVQGDPNPANNGIFYFLTDHLGSTTVTAGADGEPGGELRYRGASRAARPRPPESDTQLRHRASRAAGRARFIQESFHAPAAPREPSEARPSCPRPPHSSPGCFQSHPRKSLTKLPISR